MERKYALKQHSESGMTLIEILASVVILTIILSIVFMVFIQTAKTTNTTDETIDATYIGQTEMERVYAASTQGNFESWAPADGFIAQDPITGWSKVYERQPDPDNDQPFRVKIQLNKEDDGMVRVLIRVYDIDEQNEDKPLVQMENLYKWEESDSQ